MEIEQLPREAESEELSFEELDASPLVVGVCVDVTTLSTMTREQAGGAVTGVVHDARGWVASREYAHGDLFRYLPASRYAVDLYYPLSCRARVVVACEPNAFRAWGPRGISIGEVLWLLAQAYVEIYREPDRWGIWGHAMGDLVFEKIYVRSGMLVVGVGS